MSVKSSTNAARRVDDGSNFLIPFLHDILVISRLFHHLQLHKSPFLPGKSFFIPSPISCPALIAFLAPYLRDFENFPLWRVLAVTLTTLTTVWIKFEGGHKAMASRWTIIDKSSNRSRYHCRATEGWRWLFNCFCVTDGQESSDSRVFVLRAREKMRQVLLFLFFLIIRFYFPVLMWDSSRPIDCGRRWPTFSCPFLFLISS